MRASLQTAWPYLACRRHGMQQRAGWLPPPPPVPLTQLLQVPTQVCRAPECLRGRDPSSRQASRTGLTVKGARGRASTGQPVNPPGHLGIHGVGLSQDRATHTWACTAAKCMCEYAGPSKAGQAGVQNKVWCASRVAASVASEGPVLACQSAPVQRAPASTRRCYNKWTTGHSLGQDSSWRAWGEEGARTGVSDTQPAAVHWRSPLPGRWACLVTLDFRLFCVERGGRGAWI